MNWLDSPRQLDYFKSIKNRIKVKDNDTKWWWTSTPYPSSSTHFCNVSLIGAAINNAASNMDGGVAPAICII
jgi:hypothetical protein